jgi:Protein of unknown function (DUF429)
MNLPAVRHYYGVDFSGAKLAGRNAWVAHAVPRRRTLELVALDRLETLAGTADRTPALARLVELVRESDAAVWGCDFPFGLPVELFPPGTRWADQLDFLAGWADDAYACGLECVRRARLLATAHHRTALHCRRVTDVEAKAPFDTFHYRIIYQTFFGMRDVVGPLGRSAGTCVLPFQYRRLPTARRVVVESCPGTVLKAWGLPHQNYKRPAGGPLGRVRKVVRHRILAGLAARIDIPDRFRRILMRNPGGDALDAALAAVGAAVGFRRADHLNISRHPRYRFEGRLYAPPAEPLPPAGPARRARPA